MDFWAAIIPILGLAGAFVVYRLNRNNQLRDKREADAARWSIGVDEKSARPERLATLKLPMPDANPTEFRIRITRPHGALIAFTKRAGGRDVNARGYGRLERDGDFQKSLLVRPKGDSAIVHLLVFLPTKPWWLLRAGETTLIVRVAPQNMAMAWRSQDAQVKGPKIPWTQD